MSDREPLLKAPVLEQPPVKLSTDAGEQTPLLIGSRGGLPATAVNEEAGTIATPTYATYGDRRQHVQPETTAAYPIMGQLMQNTLAFLGKYLRGIGISLLVALLIILSLMLICTIPHYVAQHALNQAQLQLDHVELSEMTNKSIRLRGRMKISGVVGALYAGKMYKSTVQVSTLLPATNHTDLDHSISTNMKRVVIGRMEVPEVTLDGSGTATLYMDSRLHVTSAKGMSELVRQMLESDQVTLHVQGKTQLTSHGLTLNGVQLDKDITLAGFQGLNNVTVLTMDLPRDHPNGGIEMAVKVDIYNPADTTLHLPGLALRAFYKDVHMSDMAARDVEMRPGSNKIQFYGRLLPQLDNQTALETVAQFVQRYMSGKGTPLLIQGRGISDDTVMHGAPTTPITWLDEALRTYRTSMIMPGAKQVDLITELTRMELDMDFTDTSRPYHPLAHGTISAHLAKLFGFPMRVKEVAMESEFSLKLDHLPAPVPFARFYVPTTKAITQLDPHGDIVTFSVNHLPIAGLPGQEEVFQEFITQLTLKPSLRLVARGNATVLVDTAIGALPLRKLTSNFESVLKGMNGFRGTPLSMSDLSIVNATREMIYIRANATVVNPTDFGCHLNIMRFVLVYDGVHLGEVLSQPVIVQPGQTEMVTYTRLLNSKNKQKKAALSRFFSNYLSGQAQPVEIIGHRNATDLPSTLPAFQQLSIKGILPAVNDSMLQDVTIHILWTPSVVVRMRNPIPGAVVTLYRVKSVVRHEGVVIGESEWIFKKDTDLPPIELPPGVEVETPRLPVDSSTEGMNVVRKYIGKEMHIDMNVTAYVTAGDFPISVQWLQEDVVAKVRIF